MKTLLRLCACLLLGCVLTACPETTVNDDFGLKPLALKASDWSGNWQPLDDDDMLQFSIVDAAQGILSMTEPSNKKVEPLDFKLRSASADDKVKLCFALLRDKDAAPSATQIHLMRESEKGALLVWMINDEAVEAAIKSGQLQGTTKRVKDDPHTQLDAVPATYPKLLEPQFWSWSVPMVLKRQKK